MEAKKQLSFIEPKRSWSKIVQKQKPTTRVLIILTCLRIHCHLLYEAIPSHHQIPSVCANALQAKLPGSFNESSKFVCTDASWYCLMVSGSSSGSVATQVTSLTRQWYESLSAIRALGSKSIMATDCCIPLSLNLLSWLARHRANLFPHMLTVCLWDK